MGKQRKKKKVLVFLLTFVMVCSTFLGNIGMAYAQTDNSKDTAENLGGVKR